MNAHRPPVVEKDALVVSPVEIVQTVRRPDGCAGYLHCRWTEEGWKPCVHCGDLAGVTEFSRGGIYPSVDELRCSCSRYGRY